VYPGCPLSRLSPVVYSSGFWRENFLFLLSYGMTSISDENLKIALYRMVRYRTVFMLHHGTTDDVMLRYKSVFLGDMKIFVCSESVAISVIWFFGAFQITVLVLFFCKWCKTISGDRYRVLLLVCTIPTHREDAQLYSTVRHICLLPVPEIYFISFSYTIDTYKES
jgi:hypothetical protein